MAACPGPLSVRDQALGIAVMLALAAGAIAGCGPSEEQVRADINEVCVALVEALAELDASPVFPLLAGAADEASFEFGAAAYRIEAISEESPADEFAAALHAVDKAYDDIELQIATRDHATLAETRVAGEAALAEALAAAAEIGAPDCLGIGSRAQYFSIAADGAEASAALIAPTGDYVADVNAACARFADDTFAVFLKVELRYLIGGDVEGAPDPGDYIEAIEDLLAIERALAVLVRELGVIVPPVEAQATHALLIEGYQGALDALEGLRSSGGTGGDGLEVSIEQVRDAADRLGVDCSL